MPITDEKVCIILVNYNGCKDTIQCIESLQEINYSNYMICVIDNGSTDGSYKTLKEKYGDTIKLIDTKENKGFSGGNNVGIRWAAEQNIDYFLLLNNDTFVEPDFLNRLMEKAGRMKDCAIYTPKIYYADRRTIWYAGGAFNRITGRVRHTGIHSTDVHKYNEEKSVTFVSGCCMLLSAQIIQKVGLLNEDFFLYCEDLEYCCRLMQHHCKLIYCPSSVIYHKVSAASRKSPELTVYYTVRNKQYIIDQYISPKYRVFAKLYHFYEISKRIVQKEYTVKTVKRAMKDYKKGIVGKWH